MIPWRGGRPQNFTELYSFYFQYVILLYSEVQSQNSLPQETLFEINAAFNHVARHWTYNQPEQEAVSLAFGHLKRSCLDLFKMKVVEARKQYDELRRLDTSVINNGEFDRDLRRLFNEIRRGAIDARQHEGELDGNDLVPSFELWEAVYVNCERLETDFYLCPHVEWARKKTIIAFLRRHALDFVLGVTASLVATMIYIYFTTH